MEELKSNNTKTRDASLSLFALNACRVMIFKCVLAAILRDVARKETFALSGLTANPVSFDAEPIDET